MYETLLKECQNIPHEPQTRWGEKFERRRVRVRAICILGHTSFCIAMSTTEVVFNSHPFLFAIITRETIQIYAQAIHKLVMDIACKLAQGMGLASFSFEGWPCKFRINKYNFSPKTVNSSGGQIHTDSGFLTILQEDENVGGLEVMDKSGTVVAVEPLPGTLLVNLGDTAKVWSNGRLCNVKHRVVCKEPRTRMSIASFLLGPKEAKVEAPAELVDSSHPHLYVPFFYLDYRNLRISKELQAGEALDFVRANSEKEHVPELNKRKD
ncbi:unnamed protein product [Camellia sinensis]